MSHPSCPRESETLAVDRALALLVAVVVSIWNLFRTADEMAVPS